MYTSYFMGSTKNAAINLAIYNYMITDSDKKASADSFEMKIKRDIKKILKSL